MVRVQACLLEIILNLVRIQNEQLLKIICEDESIDYDDVKHIIPSAYELKKSIIALDCNASNC
jgi:hypothetical protein